MQDEKKLIKTTSQKILAIIDKISGSKKRHDAIITALHQLLVNEQHANRAQKVFLKNDVIISALDIRLKPYEGVIISTDFYKGLTGHTAEVLDIDNLQRYARDSIKGLAVVPVYKKIGDKTIAIFIVVHRQQNVALEYASDIRKIFTGPSENIQVEFIQAALKVCDELVKMRELADTFYMYDLLDALQLLSNDEVYMVSAAFFARNHIDPRQFSELMTQKGFEVSVLKNDEPKIETAEAYKFYEGMIGIVVSRTRAGIETAHLNIQKLFEVCAVAEKGLNEEKNTQ